MCGAPVGGLSVEGLDLDVESVIQGVVRRGGDAVPSAYVRLLDSTGEFTAEVVASATGGFRFFARPGEWTVRALSSQGNGETAVTAREGVPSDVEVTIA